MFEAAMCVKSSVKFIMFINVVKVEEINQKHLYLFFPVFILPNFFRLAQTV